MQPTGRAVLLDIPDTVDPEMHVMISCPECKGTDFRVLAERLPPHNIVAIACECGCYYMPPGSSAHGPRTEGTA